MRKLLITAAIVCTAAMSQAAAVTWQTSTITDYLGVNVADSAATFTAVCTIWDSTGVSVLYKSDAIANNAFSQFRSEWGDASANTAYQAQLVITSSDGKALISEKAAFTVDTSDPYNINFSSGIGFATEVPKIAEGGGSWSNIPEPTSGLLLLVGVGVLALRRKRV